MADVVVKVNSPQAVNVNVPNKTVYTVSQAIERRPILTFKNIFEFPNRGNSECLYLASDEEASYRWDNENSKYYCVGRDYTDIEIINGGNA